jgi:hypothetical protein
LVHDLVAALGGVVACGRSEGRTEITVSLPGPEATRC